MEGQREEIRRGEWRERGVEEKRGEEEERRGEREGKGERGDEERNMVRFSFLCCWYSRFRLLDELDWLAGPQFHVRGGIMSCC